MSYIGQSLLEGTRRVYNYTATSSQTSFHAVYQVGVVDVYKNGLLLAPDTYTATDGANIVLDTGASAGDKIAIHCHNTFSVTDTVPSSGGSFTGDVTMQGNLNVQGTTTTLDSASAQTIDLGDNDKIRLGDGDDLQIYAASGVSFIKESGSGNLNVNAANFILNNADDSQNMFKAKAGAEVELYFNNSQKLETTSTGVDVTGTVTADGLTVDSSSNIVATLGSSGSSAARLHFNNTGMTTAGDTQLLAQNNDLAFNTNGIERMRISSSGSVGIGLASNIGATLHVDPATNVTTAHGSPLIKVGGANSWAGNGSIYSIGLGYVNADTNKSPAEIGLDTTSGAGFTKGDLVFATRDVTTDTTPTERMRIDSSGNLLVGHDGSGSYPFTGHTIRGGDSAIFSRTGSTGETLQVRRQNSTGELVRFYSGSSTNAGGIKIDGGSMVIGGGDVGIGYYQGANALVPYNFDNLAVRDSEIDLGYTGSFRWKDLYLSGGIGFDSRTNKLDDYEEGVMTNIGTNVGTVGSGSYGRYTKIGNMVTVFVQVDGGSNTTATTEIHITGMPFTAQSPNTTGHAGNGAVSFTSNMPNVISAVAASNNTYVFLSQSDSTNITFAETTGTWAIRFTISYQVA